MEDRLMSDIIGLTFNEIILTLDAILFKTDNRIFLMYHNQECCESVTIEDIIGDMNYLIGSPILNSYETTNLCDDFDIDTNIGESYTWTFYHMNTNKGYVTIRWFGTSNGYYSESAKLVELDYYNNYDMDCVNNICKEKCTIYSVK